MRSFTFAAFTSIAFGIFCSAAPTPSGLPTVNLPPVAVAARDTTVPVPAAETPSLQSLITDATTSLKPLADRVSGLNTVEAVEDVLGPILQDIIDILKCVVTGVDNLANIPVEESLLDITTGVELDVQGVVGLVVSLLTIVLTILQTILTLVTGTVKENVVPLVDEIAELLGTILCGVLKLVGDLVTDVLDDVLQLISGLIPFILDLNVRLLLTALGIQSS